LDARNEAFLRENGITCVVNCAEADLQSPLPNLRHLCLRCNDDVDYPILGHLPRIGVFVDEQPVLFHCYAGVNRSVCLAIAYAMQKGFTFGELLKRVRKTRPFALDNVGFAKQLERIC
jgi:protein-tyrosine phosphatase